MTQEFFIITPKGADNKSIKILIPSIKEIFNDTSLIKSFRLLFWIVTKLDCNTLRFYMSPKMVCKELKISRKNFYNWRNVLIEKKIIFPLDRYLYELKPYSIVKGTMKKTI